MTNGIAATLVSSLLEHSRRPHTMLFVPVSSSSNASDTSAPSHTSYQLSSEERIAALEAEIFNLRAKRPGFTPIIRTRAQKAQAANTESEEPTVNPTVPHRHTTPPSTQEPPPPVQQRPSAHKNSDNSFIPSVVDDEPEHPFRNVPDATYMPPQHRNVAALPKPAPKKSDPAYRNIAPIYDAETATDIYNRSLEAPVTITQRELLSIAPDVRAQYKEATTAKRSTNTENQAQNNPQQQDRTQERVLNTLHSMPAAVALTASQHRSPPEGATVIDDPFEQYYRSLRPGEQPDPQRIIVAKDSAALRSIYPLVDNTLKVECILDPGSQIIAMSEEVCHELSLLYDPSITLNMQSANGTVDKSLGLARNVPFRIGNLTFYMQVHIIRAPAYDILFGRPFDILTESVVRNFSNEDQTITVSDPNTGQVVTVPTMPRGSPRFTPENHAGFQNLRI